MANYYALISGLPDLYVEQTSVEISSDEYLEVLNTKLTKGDHGLLDILLYEKLVKQISDIIEKNLIISTDTEIIEPENEYNVCIINELNLIRYQAEEGFVLSTGKLPQFIRTFVYNYYLQGDDELSTISSVYDSLSVEYFEFAQSSNNKFISKWFTLNKNIKNILAVYTSNKLGWTAEKYILGTTEVENSIRRLNKNELISLDVIHNIEEILKVANIEDITERERALDILRWNWLDEYNFTNIFGIENVLSYYIKLLIIERWANLNKERGSKIFRDIINELKKTGRKSLQEFKNKQLK